MSNAGGIGNRSIDFDSLENKKQLWNELQQSGYFVGFDGSRKSDVTRVFDNTVNQVRLANQNMPFGKMKEVFHELMMTNRDLFIKDSNKLTQPNSPLHVPVGGTNRISRGDNTQSYDQQARNPSYTAAGIREAKDRDFQARLERQQSDFQNLMKRNVPEEIDFTKHVSEKKIGNEMDDLVAKALAERERDLSYSHNPDMTPIAGSTQKAKQANQTKQAKPTPNSTSEKEKEPSTPKKVRFGLLDESAETDDIFLKLKRKSANSAQTNSTSQPTLSSTPNPMILNRLDEIEKKIDMIHDLIIRTLKPDNSELRDETEPYDNTENHDGETDSHDDGAGRDNEAVL
jgi:hypothetical protein